MYKTISLLSIASLLGACAPYPDPGFPSNQPQNTTRQPVTAPTEPQKQLEANRIRLEREARERSKREQAQYSIPSTTTSLSAPSPTTSKPSVKKYPTATPIPGRKGFVFNPYTNNIVDVMGIDSGKLCRDPEDPDTSHKFYAP